MTTALNGFRSLRSLLTNFFYKLMGVRIGCWEVEVRKLWDLDSESYNNYVDRIIAKVNPIDGRGNSISSLSMLYSAAPTNKSILNERGNDHRHNIISFKRYTSGTTGKRTRVSLGRKELGRMLGVRNYCYKKYGVSIQDREARLWGNKKVNFKQRIKDFLMNRKTFFVTNDMSSDELKDLVNWNPDYIYGYSSSIILLAEVAKKHKIRIPDLKLAVCTAEQILKEQKLAVESVLGCKVVEEYGSTEFDIIAFEDCNSKLRLVNPWLIVENHKDEIVVTDIYRLTQSFVKYQIGDSAELVTENEVLGSFGSKTVIRNLQGRIGNQYAYSSTKDIFHSSEFSRVICAYFDNEGDVFDFFIEQYEVGKFILNTSTHPIVGVDRFVDFVSRGIEDATGCKVEVIPGEMSGLSKFEGKRTYFIQNIYDDERVG